MSRDGHSLPAREASRLRGVGDSKLSRGEQGAPQSFPCDFCGERVERVLRIALDRDYDRMRDGHGVRYACETCSERKEQLRQGLRRG